MNTRSIPRFRFFTASLALVVSSVVLHAGEPDFGFALDQLRSNGSLPFTKKLFDHDLSLARKAAADLDRLFNENLGLLLDHEIIARTPITSRLTRITVALHFENGPLFFSVDTYQSAQRSLYLRPQFSRELTDLLPADLVFGSSTR